MKQNTYAPEVNARRSEKLRRRWQDPEHRAKMLKKQTGWRMYGTPLNPKKKATD